MRVRAIIEGVVQGVGFRPFVCRLAQEESLSGLVANDGRGVILEVQGPEERVEAFFQKLVPLKPPLAQIVRVDRETIPETPDKVFRIAESLSGPVTRARAAPDTAVCLDCLRELFTPGDRRYKYPFINCTNCGPRYTIVKNLPYDRPATTMAGFPMCPDCLAEYRNPADRRFHAQPNACPACGPRVWLADAQGREVQTSDPITLAAETLCQGSIVAVKGLGGFHLAADAGSETAVERLRQRKGREEKPLAVMVRDQAAAQALVFLDRAELNILTSPQRPILLARLRPRGERGLALAGSVAPGLARLGVMLPYAPLHHLLLAQAPPVLIMTSGNISEEPLVKDNAEALERLGRVADFFLLHDRPIQARADDSVVLAALGQPRVLRRARGYVPHPVWLPSPGPEVLALGPELKNTVCLTRGEEAFLSPHLGDLKNAPTLDFFEATIRRLEDLLQVKPQALAVDLHPDYLSTQAAERLSAGRPVIRVQHHAAHALAVLAELGRLGERPCLCLTLDGTGLGPDKTVWGGEILLVSSQGFQRIGHLKTFALPGGDRASAEPWRSALGLLHLTFGPAWPEKIPGRLRDRLGLGAADLAALARMLETGLNAPQTSSAGRLFDGLAALGGGRLRASFDGQAAMEWEGMIDPAEPGAYPFPVAEETSGLVLDPRPLLTAALADAAEELSPGRISARFHRGLSRALAQAAMAASALTGAREVALSGGCFMNLWLLTDLSGRLESLGLTPLSHRDVPPNDGGVSLGQAVAARLALAARRPDLWAAPRRLL